MSLLRILGVFICLGYSNLLTEVFLWWLLLNPCQIILTTVILMLESGGRLFMLSDHLQALSTLFQQVSAGPMLVEKQRHHLFDSEYGWGWGCGAQHQRRHCQKALSPLLKLPRSFISACKHFHTFGFLVNTDRKPNFPDPTSPGLLASLFQHS